MPIAYNVIKGIMTTACKLHMKVFRTLCQQFIYSTFINNKINSKFYFKNT